MFNCIDRMLPSGIVIRRVSSKCCGTCWFSKAHYGDGVCILHVDENLEPVEVIFNDVCDLYSSTEPDYSFMLTDPFKEKVRAFVERHTGTKYVYVAFFTLNYAICGHYHINDLDESTLKTFLVEIVDKEPVSIREYSLR